MQKFTTVGLKHFSMILLLISFPTCQTWQIGILGPNTKIFPQQIETIYAQSCFGSAKKNMQMEANFLFFP